MYLFIYLSLETGEMILGNLYLFIVFYLMENLFRNISFTFVIFSKITNGHRPQGSFVLSFSVINRDNPVNF